MQGEEIEAYMAAGIITHAGLAFSRDGKDKSYIQHKMKQDKAMLSQMLLADGPDAAYFYLCGPTWPVPDVYEALVSSLVENGGKERKAAEEYIEELKEAERYVLEVSCGCGFAGIWLTCGYRFIKWWVEGGRRVEMGCSARTHGDVYVYSIPCTAI